MGLARRTQGSGLALPVLIAVLAGLAQAASLALPWNGQPQWWLQIASLAVLAWQVRAGAPTGRRGALLGFAFATAWLCGTFWWLYISMHTYGGLAAPVTVAAILGLAAFLASYYALALGVFCRLAVVHRAGAALLFAALWTLAEMARGWLWTGFPWGAGGYAQVDGPLAVLARYVGVYGLCFVTSAIAMLLVQLRAGDLRSLRAWALVAGGLAVLGLATVDRHCAVDLCHTPAARAPAPLQLALLQGNIPQDEKFQPGSGVPLALQWYREQLEGATASLVAAPETAIPLLPQQLIPGYLEGIGARYANGSQAVLLGIPLGDEAAGYTNSVLGMRPGPAQPYRYDKHHLVPFGEFIPPFFKWFTQMMNIPLGDFNRGGVGQAPLDWAGQRIAPNICYEDLFGEELGARFADPAGAPTVFVNFSNIGWFGNTVAIDQHLHISRMRTLEFERPMVRATNTGATAIIDHRGVVTHQLERHTRGVLLGAVHGRGMDAQQGWAITPYAFWVSRWGLVPLALLAAAIVLVAALGAGRRGRAVRSRNGGFRE